MNKLFGTLVVFIITFFTFHFLFQITIGFSLAALYVLLKAQLFWLIILLPSIGMASLVSYDYWNSR
jgi:hypothetical protein